jgi:hypothetical protein
VPGFELRDRAYVNVGVALSLFLMRLAHVYILHPHVFSVRLLSDPLHARKCAVIPVTRCGAIVALIDWMIEQPPQPDVPHPPDVIKHPPPVNKPIPPGEPDPGDRPDIHPVPPPTDPAPPQI